MKLPHLAKGTYQVAIAGGTRDEAGNRWVKAVCTKPPRCAEVTGWPGRAARYAPPRPGRRAVEEAAGATMTLST